MQLRIHGQQPLNGTYQPGGNTNAAAACLAAALLTTQPVTLGNVPSTSTARALLDLAGTLGAVITGGEKPSPVELITDQITTRTLNPAITGGLVGGVLFVAPILVRRGFVRLELDFPLSRIRTHLEALRDLKQDVVITSGAVEVRAANWEYQEILLSQASVTATSMAMMIAACLGKETVIYNAASEPHVQALAHLLTQMGALIEGVGGNLLRVFGRPELGGGHATLPADHIEAASIAALIALTGGRGQIAGLHRQHMQMIARVFRRFGISLDVDDSMLFVPRHEELTVSDREEDVDASIESAPWPGFPSDLIGMATLIATQARGTSLIHEKMFNNRLLFIDKLNAMGAQIVLADPHRVLVIGRSPLFPIYMDTPDVRAGLALLGAALIADGVSTIDNAQLLNITFDSVVPKLKKLGAKIDVL